MESPQILVILIALGFGFVWVTFIGNCILKAYQREHRLIDDDPPPNYAQTAPKWNNDRTYNQPENVSFNVPAGFEDKVGKWMKAHPEGCRTPEESEEFNSLILEQAGDYMLICYERGQPLFDGYHNYLLEQTEDWRV